MTKGGKHIERKPQSASDSRKRKQNLLQHLENDIASGTPAAEAWENLSLEDYDFLVDMGVNPDSVFLTDAQQKVAQKVTRSPRPRGLTYKKKYPQAREEVYNSLVDAIQEKGAQEVSTNKNLRDIHLSYRGTQYKIVLSEPRQPKKL